MCCVVMRCLYLCFEVDKAMVNTTNTHHSTLEEPNTVYMPSAMYSPAVWSHVTA
jgi:hypothetical protein